LLDSLLQEKKNKNLSVKIGQIFNTGNHAPKFSF